MFNHVVCGGTFDHLHDGHHALIAKCFAVGRRVTIGVTSQEMALQKLKRGVAQTFVHRYAAVTRLAARFGKPYDIVEINDIYGPTTLDRSINAIVVSEDTKQGAQMINKKRLELGMEPLSIISIDMQNATDAQRISSTRVRNGHINRHGISYIQGLFSKSIYTLPKELIPVLRMPLGRSFPTISAYVSTIKAQKRKSGTFYLDNMWITVGDVTTYESKKIGIQPTLSLIDKKTRRKALNDTYTRKIIEKDCLYALNKKGTLTQDALIAIKSFFMMEHSKAIKQIVIDGEEDLLVLPVVLLAPLGALVLYGMPGRGIVVIRVTEIIKKKVYNLIQKFQ